MGFFFYFIFINPLALEMFFSHHFQFNFSGVAPFSNFEAGPWEEHCDIILKWSHWLERRCCLTVILFLAQAAICFIAAKAC